MATARNVNSNVRSVLSHILINFSECYLIIKQTIWYKKELPGEQESTVGNTKNSNTTILECILICNCYEEENTVTSRKFNSKKEICKKNGLYTLKKQELL